MRRTHFLKVLEGVIVDCQVLLGCLGKLQRGLDVLVPGGSQARVGRLVERARGRQAGSGIVAQALVAEEDFLQGRVKIEVEESFMGGLQA